MNVKDDKILMSEAAVLYYEEKHTQQEIADMMKLSRQTVSKLLNDALEEYDRLTKKLDYLKKIHMKESYPKSMCLIGMDILEHAFQVGKFNKSDTIINNCKYEEYLEYMTESRNGYAL